MKKVYLLLLLTGFLMTANSNAQVFYDGFTGTAGDNIGGNCLDATCNNNGWYTHSNSKTGTFDIVSGNLTYSGLASPTGNHVHTPGNATTPRDINSAVTITGNVAYYSALINITDVTPVSSTFDYFMHFAAGSGNSPGSNFFGRLGIKKVSSSTFHLGISYNSTTYTEDVNDRTVGTTYLIVVKVDLSVTPNVAYLWVNPTNLGGTEPAYLVSSTGTSTSPAFSSVCLRNGSTGTPIADYDEIRVGTTWADVTPLPIQVTAQAQNVSNGSNQIVNIQSSVANGKVYLVLDGEAQATQADLDAAVTAQKGSSASVTAANTDIAVSAANLTPGTYHAYAVDAFGNMSSKGTNAITVSALTPPAAPSNLSAIASSSSQIDLTWTDNASSEDHFKLEISSDGSAWTDLATLDANTTSYSSVSLTASTTYYYRVSATNAAGASAAITAQATTQAPPLAAPSAPSNLTATAISNTRIDLAWTDNSSTEDNFRLEFSTNNTDWNLLETVASNVISYSHISLSANTTYYYRVLAHNSAGNSDYSTTASAKTLSIPPAAPTNFTAFAVSKSEIDLTWTDNATDETGFSIETSPDGTGNWTLLSSTGANVTSYPHTGLTAGSTYFYRVYASNAGGNSGYATANATTLAPQPAVTAMIQTVNNLGQSAKVQSSNANGSVYIILTGIPQSTVADLDAAITAKKGSKATVTSANTDIAVSALNLTPGTYYAYAVGDNGLISTKGTNAITVTGTAMGIDENKDAEMVNAYTSASGLVIEINVASANHASAEIYSLIGNKIASYSLVSGTNTFVPNSKGIFLVRIFINNSVITKKLYFQ